jgi:hypothetical protein
MNAPQRKVTIVFSIGIGLVLMWGLATYLSDLLDDAAFRSAHPGSIAEKAFLEGLPTLLVSVIVSILLAGAFVACYAFFRKHPGHGKS